jgi:high-affinity iron transporter
MWQGFAIALREGIEMFLIVALILSYLKRTGRAVLARAVYAGIVVSLATCAGAFLLFRRAANRSLWEGLLALVAAVLVASLLVYMKRAASHFKRNIETHIESSAHVGSPTRALWGIFAFTLLMITREGMETALLISTALFQMRSAAVSLGLALGLVGAIAIGWAWTRLGRGVDLKGLLNILAAFLSIFVVQLVLYGVHELSEARVLPASQIIHDATEILGPDGRIGHLLAYSLAVVPTAWLAALWWKRRHEPGMATRQPRNAA